MAERDRFELDLAAFLRDYAEDAPTEVRPTELARHFADAYPHRRSVIGRWSLGLSPALAWTLLLAGLLLALVAGALFVGSRLLERTPVTTERTPVTTEALLSGMVTEEVEPGVLRVIGDGYRSLKHPGEGYPGECERVIVGDSDQVWLATGCSRLLRLAQEGQWHYDRQLVDLGWARSDASRDGRLWALAEGSPRLFDDGEWTPDPRLGDRSEVGSLAVQGDGTVWLLSEGAVSWVGETLTGSSPGDGLRVSAGLNWNLLGVTDDGVVWFINPADENPPLLFFRFDGTDWEVVSGPDGLAGESGNWSLPAGVSASGTVWTAGDDLAPHGSLARLDEEGWTIFTDGEGVKPWGGQPAWWGVPMDTLWVAPDGSAWVNASVTTTGSDGNVGCDGLARFDGETWQSFLVGSCISDLDFAPDGSVWVVAGHRDGEEVDTYVITP